MPSFIAYLYSCKSVNEKYYRSVIKKGNHVKIMSCCATVSNFIISQATFFSVRPLLSHKK